MPLREKNGTRRDTADRARAKQLSVLVIDEDSVRVESAAELAGRTCGDTQRVVARAVRAGFSFAVIGPAGERLVRYATISHDGRHAGRGGSGAVLGSKNIKAIAVRGTQRCEWAFPSELTSFAKQLSTRSFGPATAKYRELGTAANLLVFNRLHAPADAQFSGRQLRRRATARAESLSLSREKTRARCAACTIGCEHIYEIRPSTANFAAGLAPQGVTASASNTKTCSPSGRCAASKIPMWFCKPPSSATSSASTRSAPAARLRSPWNASSEDCFL